MRQTLGVARRSAVYRDFFGAFLFAFVAPTRRVAAAFLPAARRRFVAAAFFAAAVRRFVVAAFFAAVLRRRVAAAFLAAALLRSGSARPEGSGGIGSIGSPGGVGIIPDLLLSATSPSENYAVDSLR